MQQYVHHTESYNYCILYCSLLLSNLFLFGLFYDMFLMGELKQLCKYFNKSQSWDLGHSATSFPLGNACRISLLLQTLTVLVGCEDLHSSWKAEARDFGLTRVLQAKTQGGCIMMVTWPEPQRVEKHCTDKMGDLSLWPTYWYLLS